MHGEDTVPWCPLPQGVPEDGLTKTKAKLSFSPAQPCRDKLQQEPWGPLCKEHSFILIFSSFFKILFVDLFVPLDMEICRKKTLSVTCNPFEP